MHSELIKVNGRPVRVARGAPAPVTVVLVHGASHDHRMWEPLLVPLQRGGVRPLTVDLPGHGGSAGPLLPGVPEMASWLLATLDACGVERCVFAGHSMGSLVALHAAAQAPERAAGLALIGTAWPMRVAPRLLELARAEPATALRNMAAWSHRQRDGQPLDAAAQAATLDLMTSVQSGWPGGDLLATDLAACDAYADGARVAALVRAPTRLVLGEHDRMTPPAATAALREALPVARVVTLDSGHALVAEAADGVAAALLELATAA